LSLNCRRGCLVRMFSCGAILDTDREMLRGFEYLLEVVSWDKVVPEILLTPRANEGVDCGAFLETGRGMLRGLGYLLGVVSWEESIRVISLTSRDNEGVDGIELGEGDILVSVNKSVMCSSFFAMILMSVRPSDEVSLAG